MGKFFHQFLRVWQAVSVICVFMAVIPSPAICESIDQMIIKEDDNFRAFDMFRVSENFTISLKVELDMIMPLAQFKEVYGSVNPTRKQRAAIKAAEWRWANAIIHYELSPDIRYGAKAIRDTLDHFQKYTCMNFVESSTAENRLKFVTDLYSCESSVGFILGLEQTVLLADWCLEKKHISHVIGHAVGFYHEQSRPDRDSYIFMSEEFDSNGVDFGTVSDTSSYGVPYDYLSIMHYSEANGITTLDPAYQKRIGRSPGLSYGDIKQINLMYDCPTLRGQCPAKTCPFSGFVLFKAFKGQPACQCFCDSGDQEDPIVPCSSITKEVPGPNILAASSLATPDPKQCFNLRSDCDSLKTKGMCKKEPGRMLEQCTKTCGFCESAKDLCFDRDPGCEMMAASCTDSALQGLMSQRCRKTCKLCTQPSSACELQQSMSDSIPSRANGQAKPMDILLVVQLTIALFW